MLVNSIVGVILLFAVEGFVDGDDVSFEFGEVDFDLADWHFGDELIHIYFFLLEDWEVVLLPYFLYYEEPRVHLVVL